MTAAALALKGPGQGEDLLEASLEAVADCGPSRLTLEGMILGVWEDLDARGRADCPVCGAISESLFDGCSSCGSSIVA